MHPVDPKGLGNVMLLLDFEALLALEVAELVDVLRVEGVLEVLLEVLLEVEAALMQRILTKRRRQKCDVVERTILL